MKTTSAFKFAAGALLLGTGLHAAPPTEVEPPVPVADQAKTATVTRPTPADQHHYQPGRTLVPPEQAQAVVERFRSAYAALGSPRIVIAVNRELVDTSGGLQLTKRDEQVQETTSSGKSTYETTAPGTSPQTQVNISVGGAASGASARPTGPGESSAKLRTVTANNTYEASQRLKPTLADRQTTRDVERLFGRPLRIGGAHLADQRVVASLLADRPLDDLLAHSNDAARKDREALEKVADVVIEVLISSRAITIPGITADETRSAPDIQSTMIRLADGAILGQASATDVLGKDRDAGPVVRHFDVRDIAEATALALMEDVAVTAPTDQP